MTTPMVYAFVLEIIIAAVALVWSVLPIHPRARFMGTAVLAVHVFVFTGLVLHHMMTEQ